MRQTPPKMELPITCTLEVLHSTVCLKKPSLVVLLPDTMYDLTMASSASVLISLPYAKSRVQCVKELECLTNCVFFLTVPQNYLRVALQELDSGCTAKTLQVRPYATVEEVCQLCAQKFKVSDPENYSLFLLMEGSSQQLAPDTHPQKIKAELHSRPQVAPFHFVFRRVAKGNTSSSAPLDPTPNHNDLTVTSDPLANLNDLSMDLSAPCPQPTFSLGLSPNLSLSLPPSHLNGNTVSI